MKIYFAPLESVTGYQYRNAHHAHFDGIDQYYTPFISPNSKRPFKNREKNDVVPEHNVGLNVVPQVLTNNAEFFLNVANELQAFGYEEVNLNLGCPSGTVVSKGKGSGFLAKTDELHTFLEEIFAKTPISISVKTRTGKDSHDEFAVLLEMFNEYPMKELIIHPRTQLDFYRNTPNLDAFELAVNMSKNPICYNGDIFTKQDYESFIRRFPQVESIMLGRGLIANPALAQYIKEERPLTSENLKAFHDDLYEVYKDYMSGAVPVLHKMKELWFYMSHMFADNEKAVKKIRKSQSLGDYEAAVSMLFTECELVAENGLFS